MPKKFGVNWAKIKSTCFTKCHLGKNGKRTIGGIFWNMAMQSFAIFDEDRTQRIYKNYLGIFGVTERWVASQTKAMRIIPLIEKEYSQ